MGQDEGMCALAALHPIIKSTAQSAQRKQRRRGFVKISAPLLSLLLCAVLLLYNQT